MNESNLGTSLTNQAIGWMLHSDFFCPPKYELVQGDSIDELYQNRKLKNRIPYIDEGFRILARMIYMLGVTVLLPPIGTVYHGYQWLHKERKFNLLTNEIEKLKDQKINNSNDNHRLQYELVKICKERNASRDAFYSDRCQLMVLIAGVINLKILCPFLLAHAATSSLAKTGLFSAATVGVMMLAFQASQILSFAFVPHLAAKESWFGKELPHRSELLNKKVGFSFVGAVENRAHRLVDCLKELQEKLPEDCKMPLITSPLKSSVLDWIEGQKNTLIAQSCWKEIKPLCQKFAQLHDQLVEVGEDRTDQFEQSILLELSKISNPHSSEKATVKEQDKVLSAFSFILFKKMCGSNLFYPSYCELVEKQPSESLLRTISNENAFLNRKKISFWTHLIKRPLCFTARAVAFVGIGLIGVPAGLIYHGLQTLRFSVSYIIQQDSVAKYKNWERMLGHISQLWVDATYALTGGHFFDMSTYLNLSTLGAGIMTVYFLPLSTIITTGLVCSIALYALAAIWSPTSLVSSFAYKDERTSLFKSIALRQYCGYTTPGGGLLPYNKILDNATDQVSGRDYVLMQFWVSSGMEVLEVLRQVASVLTRIERHEIAAYFGENSIDYNGVIRYLERLSNGVKESSKQAICVHNSKQEQLNQTIAKLKQLKDAISESRWLIQECYRVGRHDCTKSVLRDGLKALNILDLPEFPYSLDEIQRKFGSIESTSKWEDIIQRERLVLKVLKVQVEQNAISSIERRIQEIHQLLSDETKVPNPLQILGLADNASLEEIKKKYHRDALLFHPDRVPELIREKATFFFKIVNDAKEILLEEKQGR